MNLILLRTALLCGGIDTENDLADWVDVDGSLGMGAASYWEAGASYPSA